MENKSTVSKTQTEKEMEEFLKQNADVIFKKSSSQIGSRVQEKTENERVVIDGGFTKVFINFLFKYFKQEFVSFWNVQI